MIIDIVLWIFYFFSKFININQILWIKITAFYQILAAVEKIKDSVRVILSFFCQEFCHFLDI